MDHPASDQDFDAFPPEGAERLVVDLDGFEGPLDLMLDLARREKLDLKSISILAIAEQYLAFIAKAQALRLEIAGDYLVMAAWLAYLKSRLLLPKRENDPAPEAEAMIEDLAARLARLEVIRKAGQLLGERLAQTRESFPRGLGETIVIERKLAWDVSLTELVAAYAERRIAQVRSRYRISTRKTLSIPDARALLERLIGPMAEWCPLDVLLAAIRPSGEEARSTKASSFVAALELAREGQVELRQQEAFAPLYLRRSGGATGSR